MGKELETAATGSASSSEDTSTGQLDAAETAGAAAEGAEGGEATGEAAAGAAGAEKEGEGAAAEGGEAAAASAGAVDEWKSDAARFKVDGKELEYDPKVRAILTKENEPLIRELQEKAHGIDAIKIRHEEVKTEREQLRGQLSGMAGTVREILAHRDAGDFDSFLEACNIPFEKMAAWMHQKLQREAALPPEARGVYDENSRSRRELSDTKRQIESLRSDHDAAVAQVGAMRLDTTLADPGIKEIADEFDARMGKPGSFRTNVIRHAATYEMTTRQSIGPEEAVKSYLEVIGRSPGVGKPAAPAPVTTTKPKVLAAHKPATIPNVGPSAKSPAKTTIRSVQDLRRIAKEKGA